MHIPHLDVPRNELASLVTFAAQLEKEQSPRESELIHSISEKEALIPLAEEILIACLHLPLRTHNALIGANIENVGQLLTLPEEDFRRIPNLGRKGIESVDRAISSLLDSANSVEGVDWFRFWDLQGIKIIPSAVSPDMTVQEIIAALPTVIKLLLEQSSDSRLWTIIQRRFGLDGTATLTLAELGLAFGITRERVRMLEEDTLDELYNILVAEDYAGKGYRVHPVIATTLKQVIQMLMASCEQGIVHSQLMNSSFDDFAP